MTQPNIICGENRSSLSSPALSSPADSVASCFWFNACNYSDCDAFAIVTGEDIQWLTWGELGRLAARRVADLQHMSLEPGAHLASCLPNSLDWILLDVAAQTLGLVHVAIDPREAVSQRQALFEFSEARYLFASTSDALCRLHADSPLTVGAAARLASRVQRTAAAQMLFTSGSDGLPKGVMLSHHNLLSNARAKLEAAPQLPSDLRLNLLPFAHAYARTCELSTWILSHSRLAIAASWEDVLRQAPRLRPTLMNLVPYLAQRVAETLECDAQALGGRLRLLQVGGAALNDELWQRLLELGLPPLQGYGLTEAAPVVCSNRAGRQRPGSVGPPVAGVELRVDAANVLWCCGPNVMLGYWRNEAATQACLLDGWLCTGDVANITADGSVQIVGRASQQIVLSTGYKVSPELIERELCGEVGIEHAVVCGQGRPHVVALLWPSPADAQGGVAANSSRPKEHWQARIAARLSSFPRYAIPRHFAWIEPPLSVESGLLTAKGSVRRGPIATCYGDTIDDLYREQTA